MKAVFRFSTFAGLSLLTVVGCAVAAHDDSEREPPIGRATQAVSAEAKAACSFAYTPTALGGAPSLSALSKGFGGSGQLYGDATGDGKSDILAITALDAVTTYVGNGDGTFTKGPETKLPAPVSGKIFVGLGIVGRGDFDGDGIGDIVMLSTTAYATQPGGTWFGRFVFLYGSASGAFDSIAQTGDVMTSGGGTNIHIARDFDGDGRDDFVYGNYGSQSIIFANPGRTFSSATSVGSGNPGGVVALGASLFFLSGATATKITWIGARAKSTQALQAPSMAATVASDFDGDGKLDLADKLSGATPALRIGTIDTTSSMATLYGFKGYVQPLLSADLIGDGKQELVYVDNDLAYAACGYTPGTTDLVATALGIPLPYGVSLARAGDLNGDGKADFVATKNGISTAYLSGPKPAQVGPQITLTTTPPASPPVPGPDTPDATAPKPPKDGGTPGTPDPGGEATPDPAAGEAPGAPATTTTTSGCSQTPTNARSGMAGLLFGALALAAAARRRRARA